MKLDTLPNLFLAAARFLESDPNDYFGDRGYATQRRDLAMLFRHAAEGYFIVTDKECVLEDDPDWFYCDDDPEESGDSAYEAMFYHRGRLTPVKLRTTYYGPVVWGVMSPPLPDADCDEETAHVFETEEEAKAFCEQRKGLINEDQ